MAHKRKAFMAVKAVMALMPFMAGVLLVCGLNGSEASARPGAGAGRSPGRAGPGVGAPGAGVRPGAGPGVGAPGAGVRPGAGPANVRSVENFIAVKPAAKSAAASQRTGQLKTSLNGIDQPFTASWYAAHPSAWRYVHPYANVWGVVGVVRLSSWLGYSAQAGSVESTQASVATADGTQSVLAEAQNPAPPQDLEWMPLGVYAAAPAGTAPANAFIQLAVGRDGTLQGNYIDTISDQSTAIVGSIDKESRKASWAVGKSKNAVRFETTLDGLMDEASQAVVQSAAGRQQTWDLVRLSQPTDSDQPTADK